MIGFLCGTGFEHLLNYDKVFYTPFGKIYYSKVDDIYAVNRHMNNIPPHKIPYKAIVYFFKKMNVRFTIAMSAVGSLRNDINVGNLVLPNQLIDFSGIHTFFDNSRTHASMLEPFSKRAREILRTLLKENSVEFFDGGTYICMPGPQFETLAEIEYLRKLGDVVGMTVGPEAKLHREMNIDYQPLCIVTNVAGVEAEHEKNVEEAKKVSENIYGLIISDKLRKIYMNY